MSPLHRTLPLVALALVCALAAPAQSQSPPRFRVGATGASGVEPLADAERLAAWGADYVEPSLSRIAGLSDAEFEAARTRARASRVPVEAANSFVPGSVRLTGPDANRASIRAYLEKALARAEALGIQVVVFGSSGARNVPEGFPRDKAWAQLRDFLNLCADVIHERGFGMVVAIEPLRRQESNIVNTAAEGLKLAREVNRPQVRLLVDFYHLAVENEDPDVLLEVRDMLVHAHIAEPKERRLVRDESEDVRLGRFFANLRTIGYRGRISVEGRVNEPESDFTAGLRFLRSMAEKYR